MRQEDKGRKTLNMSTDTGVILQQTLEKQASRAATYSFSFFSLSFLFSSSCWAVVLTFTLPCF